MVSRCAVVAARGRWRVLGVSPRVVTCRSARARIRVGDRRAKVQRGKGCPFVSGPANQFVPSATAYAATPDDGVDGGDSAEEADEQVGGEFGAGCRDRE
jgi:hypothetical protein